MKIFIKSVKKEGHEVTIDADHRNHHFVCTGLVVEAIVFFDHGELEGEFKFEMRDFDYHEPITFSLMEERIKALFKDEVQT